MVSSLIEQLAQYSPCPSLISNHEAVCCRTALAWFRGIDATFSYMGTDWHPPKWLRRKYDWGPVPWPLFWCSVAAAQRLDCGALAALAVQLYRFRGQPVTPAQLILRYPIHATEQWSRMWEREDLDSSWIVDNLCYHEACAVLDGSRLTMWDPTESRWLEPPGSPKEGFAAVVAVRIFKQPGLQGTVFDWEGVPVTCGIWNTLAQSAHG